MSRLRAALGRLTGQLEEIVADYWTNPQDVECPELAAWSGSTGEDATDLPAAKEPAQTEG